MVVRQVFGKREDMKTGIAMKDTGEAEGRTVVKGVGGR